MEFQPYFKDKKITLMGLGLLGRGINVARFLAENGADLIITDLKNRAELAPALAELKDFQIKYVLGKHQLGDFKNRDMVIKAAGVPLDSLFIKEAISHGIPVEMDASLFAKLSPAKLIGITGTRGKSTVTKMIYHGLKNHYSAGNIYLGGNIKGKATLPLLNRAESGDWAVLELDSWQLQGFGDSKISPQISIFTNFLPDHLNYYQNDMKRYFKDKANIFKYQNENDYLILTKQAQQEIEKRYSREIKSNLILAGGLPKDWQLNILGEHNRINAALAKQVLELMGLDREMIKETIENYSGEPGRLEFIREVRGVRYYNDTNATTPEACMAALDALNGDKGIVLIAGGADKGLEFNGLIQKIKTRVKALVLIRGSATEKILQLIPKSGFCPIKLAADMEEAVQQANQYVQKGEIALLSPAAASFGVFKNEYDRGEQFVKEVKAL